MPEIYVPDMYDEYTTRRVGQRISFKLTDSTRTRRHITPKAYHHETHRGTPHQRRKGSGKINGLAVFRTSGHT